MERLEQYIQLPKAPACSFDLSLFENGKPEILAKLRSISRMESGFALEALNFFKLLTPLKEMGGHHGCAGCHIPPEAMAAFISDVVAPHTPFALTQTPLEVAFVPFEPEEYVLLNEEQLPSLDCIVLDRMLALTKASMIVVLPMVISNGIKDSENKIVVFPNSPRHAVSLVASIRKDKLQYESSVMVYEPIGNHSWLGLTAKARYWFLDMLTKSVRKNAMYVGTVDYFDTGFCPVNLQAAEEQHETVAPTPDIEGFVRPDASQGGYCETWNFIVVLLFLALPEKSINAIVADINNALHPSSFVKRMALWLGGGSHDLKSLRDLVRRVSRSVASHVSKAAPTYAARKLCCVAQSGTQYSLDGRAMQIVLKTPPSIEPIEEQPPAKRPATEEGKKVVM